MFNEYMNSNQDIDKNPPSVHYSEKYGKNKKEETVKKLEEEKQNSLKENNNKENEIKEKNSKIEELNKNLSIKSDENERLNKIVSEIEEKKKLWIILNFLI